MSLTFYHYPNCDTCRKAKKWMDEQGLSYEATHIVNDPPSREEIQDIYENSGLELKKLFNTSGKRYRELGMKDKMKDSTEEELLDLLASDAMLIKRPLVSNGTKATVGFKEETFSETWK
ncbi:arsenate reductase family protein [Evansella clarkii]|uniref:arsenate reductase family protein n=1 Tax=Evansella clarkii TaxID=79879 RepID=UPI000998157F|nr:arsenate reductase family protein [Evansella clarkii]